MARLASLRDTPNTSREYETIYILRPNTPNEQVAEVNTRVKGIIEGMGGKILKVDNWGKRRLAYEVAKERKGIYLYWLYLASPGVVEETERNLRMLDSVIRYLTVKVDENIDIAARPSEIDDTAYDRAATTAADEEDMFLSRGAEESPEAAEGEGDDFDAEALEAPAVAVAPAPEAAVEGKE
ncbi:MAG: 30S ribosomal protein S6 [Myxococcales bacterium]|nr:30S ribosomal protein S6 [Myxococcales bacterium]HRC54472.1 30S ribosomal protein S6 [Kofleriaceae bacterium]